MGLGDHIICNGLVRTLINENDRYTLFVKPHNKLTVEFMYRDLPNLEFYEGDDNEVTNFINRNGIPQEDLIVAGFYYRHPNAKEFDDSFYLQHNIPFFKRWENFYVDRDLESEMKLFKQFGLEENKYVFIHDDINRGYRINEEKIVNKDLPIIRPVHGLTNNVFDYCYLMKNSLESHFIDSSFRLIFDSLKLRNTNIFYHINLVGGVLKDNTKSQSFLNFEIV